MANLFRVASSDTLQFVVESIAPEFSESEAYIVGDHVIKDDLLYECTQNTKGPWDETKWKRTYLSELYLKNIAPCPTGYKAGSGSFPEAGRNGSTGTVTANVVGMYQYMFKKFNNTNFFVHVDGVGAHISNWHEEDNFSVPSAINYVPNTGIASTSGTGSAYVDIYVLPKGAVQING